MIIDDVEVSNLFQRITLPHKGVLRRGVRSDRG